jgi:glucan phosphorylase
LKPGCLAGPQLQAVLSKLQSITDKSDSLLQFHNEITRSIENSDDVLGLALDFESYCHQWDAATEAFFSETDEFSARQINTVANCGDLSSDRMIIDYQQEVWNLRSVAIPKTATQQKRMFPVPMLNTQKTFP